MTSIQLAGLPFFEDDGFGEAGDCGCPVAKLTYCGTWIYARAGIERSTSGVNPRLNSFVRPQAPLNTLWLIFSQQSWYLLLIKLPVLIAH